MGRLPRRARAYLLLVVACGALLLAESNPISRPPDRDALLLCGVMGFLLVLADTRMIEVSHSTKLSVSTAVEFALLLMVGPALAVWTIAVGVGLAAYWQLRRAWKWYSIVFYAANGVVSVGVAGIVYHQAAGGVPLLSSGISMLAVVLAAMTYFVLNVGIVATMVVLARSSDTLGNFFSSFQAAAPQFAGLLALGLVGAAVYDSSPLAALLLVIPLAGVYSSLRSSLTLRTETKRAIEALALEVDEYHPYTAQHSERVEYYAGKIGRKLQLSEDQVEIISRAARIHDLGKLSIWRDMLNKPSALTTEELVEVHTHPARGADLVSGFPDYRNGRELILHHHERYDGAGYPSGLRGDEIPLGARIIAVADATDAMMSDRPYRKALSMEDTIAELGRNRGKQFDPVVVEAMLEILAAESRVGVRQRLSRTPAMA